MKCSWRKVSWLGPGVTGQQGTVDMTVVMLVGGRDCYFSKRGRGDVWIRCYLSTGSSS